MMFEQMDLEQGPLRAAITDAFHMDEATAVDRLIGFARFSPAQQADARRMAKLLIEQVRQHGSNRSGIEAFMYHYDLSCEEGILLMCLAEALLRIPDKETEQLLIKDKLTSATWESHLGQSESSFVNAATWGLTLTGKLLSKDGDGNMRGIWRRMIKRSGEPVIRKAIREVMKVLSQQFVVGRSIEEALSRSKKQVKQGYCYSYDMLGEAARTQEDADKYMLAYEHAIKAIGKARKGDRNIFHGPSISVKLSALHPRYEFANQQEVVPYLVERVRRLALMAKQAHMSMTIDAEESYRLDISLDIIEQVFAAPELADWQGLGLAVQAYQKRCFYLVDWLADLAKRYNKRIQVRLVKGAYWDTEIKLAQVEGYREYPVFTRKTATDVSYIACAKKLIAHSDVIYPQFATHNAYSVAAILALMGERIHDIDFEFQNLQGMGRALHDHIVNKHKLNIPCRIYAPVGVHEDLLPYLVRRLLENGANTSFVNQVADDDKSLDDLIQDPIEVLASLPEKRNTRLPLPRDIYGDLRKNSQGLDLSDLNELRQLQQGLDKASSYNYYSGADTTAAVTNPATHETFGSVATVDAKQLDEMIAAGQQAFHAWNNRPLDERCAIIRKAGDMLDTRRDELMYIAIREAGKTVLDAIAEVREAVDFCYYYPAMAEQTLAPKILLGPTGESNELHMHGRGVFACISPWNFPVAIFTGQVTAALVAGNAVIAKPAGQTAYAAQRVVEILHEAGVPADVLQLAPGSGRVIGNALAQDERIAGLMFTGSTEVAKTIQMNLAKREGPIVPLIAETGGMNAMIADSSALHEQLVEDVIRSAFGSAGQRCSALRVLYLQEEMADDVIAMLKGAMATLRLNDPMLLSTDVGPVIDQAALDELQAHAQRMDAEAQLIYKVDDCALPGSFFAPRAYELKDPTILKREVFGPILHIVRYKQADMAKVIDQINDFGYGLTFGVHSRIADTIDYIVKRIEVGNVYVNRNTIGAVVGVQPFGGCKLSGTGPKAGGPHYLLRLSDEKTITVNTTAAGGNASLMTLGDE